MSPPRKKEKKEDVNELPVDNSLSGIIRFDVDNVSTLDSDGLFSPVIEVGGVPWRAEVSKEKIEKDGQDALYIYLKCMNGQSKQWSIDVKAVYVLLNADSSKNITKTDTDSYNNKETEWALSLLYWKYLMNEKMGFIKDDKITVEIRFSILKMKGIGKDPPKEKRKKEAKKREKKVEVAVPESVDSNSALIRLSFGEPYELDNEGLFSNAIEVGGMPWRVNIGYNREDDEDSDFEGDVDRCTVYLCNMHKQSTTWSVEARVEYAMTSSMRNHEEENYNTFTYRQDRQRDNGFGLSFFPKSLEHITMKIRLTIISMKGIRTAPHIDFTDAKDPRQDLALVIGEGKIFVNRGLLAFLSPVFNARFYGSSDKYRKEITLNNVDCEEFTELLSVIFPSGKSITEDSVRYILKLGERFQIASAIQRAEEFLVATAFVSEMEKLLLAEKHRLFGLQYHVVSELKTTEDVEEMQKSRDYSSLSDATRAAVAGRLKKVRPGKGAAGRRMSTIDQTRLGLSIDEDDEYEDEDDC